MFTNCAVTTTEQAHYFISYCNLEFGLLATSFLMLRTLSRVLRNPVSFRRLPKLAAGQRQLSFPSLAISTVFQVRSVHLSPYRYVLSQGTNGIT